MATYYVATDGSGDFTTIAQVNATTFANGDNVLFRKGDSWSSTLVIPSGGVTYGSYGIGNKPQLKRITSVNKSNIVIDGIKVYQIDWGNAFIINGGINIILSNIYVEDSGFGGASSMVYFRGNETVGWVDNLLVDNCEFVGGYNTPNIDVQARCKNVVIQNCTSHDSGNNNYQIYNSEATTDANQAPYNVQIKNCKSYSSTGGHGIEIGWGAHDITIEKCYTHDNHSFGLIVVTKNIANVNLVTKNNVFYNNSYGDISIEQGGSDCKVYNNAFIVGNNTQRGIWVNSNAGTGNVIKNNIFYKNIVRDVHLLKIDAVGKVTSNNNCFYAATDFKMDYNGTEYNSLAKFVSASGQDANSISQDPLFKSATDYHLQKTSPCRGIGAILPEVTDDYEGNPRPMNGGYDLGAYQYYSSKIRNATLQNAEVR